MKLPALELLLAEQACRHVILEAAQAIDTQDYATFAGLFAPNGVLIRPNGQQIDGRSAIEQAYGRRDPDRLTRHLITNHLITVHNSASASSRCNVLLWSGHHSDPSDHNGRPADADEFLGEFLDELVASPEGWRIQQRRARFILHRAG